MTHEKDIKINSITLESGELKFSAITAGEGQETVFLLHGFPDSSATFKTQLPALAAAGYRVIAPNLRGYEPSSQPDSNEYHVLDMAQDVINWLDSLDLQQVHLVGHDWGSIIAQTAAMLKPERFISLTLVAVPYMGKIEAVGLKVPRQILNSWYMIFFQLPVVSNWVVTRKDYKFIETLWRTWSPGWQWPKSMMRELKQLYDQPGVVQAMLSYYRQNILAGGPKNRRLRKMIDEGQSIHVPTLGLYGSNDGCIDRRAFKHCMHESDFAGGMELAELSNAGHFLHLESPSEVNTLLLDWFQGNESKLFTER